MAIYQGVNGVNREIKQIFEGVGGVNREVKERWEGVGGVNRQVFSIKPAGALYWEGDECVPLTGGYGKTRDEGGGTLIKNVDNMHYTAGSGHAICIAPLNIFNFTKYKSLYVDLEGTVSGEPFSNFSVHISSNKTLSGDTRYLKAEISLSKIRQIISYDISNVNVSAYLVFGGYNNATAKIHKCWVE